MPPKRKGPQKKGSGAPESLPTLPISAIVEAAASESGAQELWRRLQSTIAAANQTNAGCRDLGKAVMSAWLKCGSGSGEEDEGQSEEVRRNLENFVIQEFFYNAIMLKVPALQTRFMNILSGLLLVKKSGIDPPIFRCTEPVLWRFLDSPNDHVRAAAVQVLLMFYPIIDADPETSATYLGKQHMALRLLLGDSSIPIRLSATKGVFDILKGFWKIIPQEDRSAICAIIAERNAVDCDVSIREAVYEGMLKLLTEAHAIAMVKKMMEVIVKKGIDDKHYRVRTAAFKLLAGLKGHRVIKFSEFVSGEHILMRLDLEHNSEVKKYIVKVMTPQFRPKKATDRERVRRILILVNNSPRAALIFHRYLYSVESMTLEEAVAHIKMIGMAVYISLKRKLSNVDWEADGIEISESLLNDTVATLSNVPDLPPITAEDGASEAFQEMKHLLDCAIVMLFTIRDDLFENAEQYTVVNKFLIFFFKKMFVTYKNTVLFESIMILGSLLPDEHIGEIASKIVRNLRDIEDEQTDVKPYLAAAFSWKTEELFELIDGGLKSLDLTNRMQQSFRKGKAAKTIKFSRALKFLEHVLANPAVTDQTLRSFATSFSRFFDKLKVVKDLISARLEGNTEDGVDQVECSNDELVKALMMRSVIAAKLISFLEEETDELYAGMIDQIRIESAKDVIWFSEIPPPEDESPLYESLSREMFHLISIHLQSCGPDPAYVSSCFNLVQAFIEGGAPPPYVVSVLKTAKHLYRAVLNMENSTECLASQMLPVLDNIIDWIKESCEDYDEHLARDISAAFASLSAVLFNISYIVKMKSIYGHIESILVKLLDEMIAAVDSSREVMDPSAHTFELPQFSNFYLKRILPRMKVDIHNYFIDVLLDHVVSGTTIPAEADNFTIVVRIAATMQLSYFLKVPRSREKDIRKAKAFLRSSAANLECGEGDERYMREQLLSLFEL